MLQAGRARGHRRQTSSGDLWYTGGIIQSTRSKWNQVSLQTCTGAGGGWAADGLKASASSLAAGAAARCQHGRHSQRFGQQQLLLLAILVPGACRGGAGFQEPGDGWRTREGDDAREQLVLALDSDLRLQIAWRTKAGDGLGSSWAQPVPPRFDMPAEAARPRLLRSPGQGTCCTCGRGDRMKFRA